METQSDIDTLFVLEGTKVFVDSISEGIPCIASFSITELYNEANENIQEQKFLFILKEADIVTYELEPDVEFTFTPNLSPYIYTFSFGLFCPDMAGCSLVTCSYIGRANV